MLLILKQVYKFLKLIKTFCATTDTTVLLITHNKVISQIADRVIEIASSKVKSDYYNKENYH